MVKLKIETDGILLDQIPIGDNVYLVIQKRTFNEKEFIDIRKYIVTKKYTGFSAKGIAIEPKYVKDLVKSLEKISKKLERGKKHGG
jgi:hypothetical protein